MTTQQGSTLPEEAIIPAPEGTEAETPSQAPEQAQEDISAKYQELQKQYEDAQKALNDARSREIATLRQKERDEALTEMREYMKLIADSMGDEDLRAKFQQIEAKRSSEELTATFQERQTEVSQEIWGSAQKLGLDPNVANEFENVRMYWAQAAKSGDLYYLERAHSEAQRVLRRLEGDMSSKQKADYEKRIKEAAEQTRKQVLEEKGFLDVDTGPGSGGGNPSLQSLLAVDTRGMTPAEAQKHGRDLDAALRRGR